MYFKGNKCPTIVVPLSDEVTEITAAELQAPAGAQDRFAGAAVRASLAAAGASNVAMFGTPKGGKDGRKGQVC